MAGKSVRPSAYELTLLVIVVVVFVWSGIGPHDRFTWVLEVFPVIIALPVLIYVYPRFRFTPLVYILMALHAVILMVGGHYTYAEVPLGFQMQEWFGFAGTITIGRPFPGVLPRWWPGNPDTAVAAEGTRCWFLRDRFCGLSAF